MSVITQDDVFLSYGTFTLSLSKCVEMSLTADKQPFRVFYKYFKRYKLGLQYAKL